VSGTYLKEGRKQSAKEVLRCSFSVARAAFEATLSKKVDFLSHLHGRYEFEKPI
jgi:hypothetical protein